MSRPFFRERQVVIETKEKPAKAAAGTVRLSFERSAWLRCYGKLMTIPFGTNARVCLYQGKEGKQRRNDENELSHDYFFSRYNKGFTGAEFL